MARIASAPVEPTVRRDGRCQTCRRKRSIPPRQPYRGAAERDPFCSSDCCRTWYGLPVTTKVRE